MSTQEEGIRAKRKSRLLAEASCHGGYLWTPRDLEHALQWFHSDDRIVIHSASAIDGETSSRKDDNEVVDQERGKLDLLRKLLQNPGVMEPRRSVQNSKTSRRRKKQKETEESTMSHDNDEDAFSSSVVDDYGGGLLYHIFLQYSCQALNEESTPATLSPSNNIFHNLCKDLTEVATERYTSELILNQYSHHFVDDNQKIIRKGRLEKIPISSFSKTFEEKGENANVSSMRTTIHQNLEQFFNEGSTIVQMAYASTLYQTCLKLLHNTPANNNTDNGSGDGTCFKKDKNNADKYQHDQSLLDKFIHKLIALCRLDNEVNQVCLLMLLQPIQAQFQSNQENDIGGTAGPSSSVSTSTWVPFLSSISTIENVISNQKELNLCQSLCHDLLPVVVSTTIQKVTCAMKDTMLSTKSLLCILSHLYFPIAKAYIMSLLDRAIESYHNSSLTFIAQYSLLDRKSTSKEDSPNAKGGRDSSHNIDNENSTEMFDSCILQLQMLITFKESLNFLCKDLIGLRHTHFLSMPNDQIDEGVEHASTPLPASSCEALDAIQKRLSTPSLP